MRRIKTLLLISLLALVVVPSAWALRFTDESFNPPFGETGKPYPNWSFTGAGGCGPTLPYQYRVLPGSAMPPGLNLASSGLVSGIPTQAGQFSLWVELSDEDPPSAAWCRTPVSKAQRQFTFTIVQGLKIVQTWSALTAGLLNEPYNLQFSATGGGTQTWTVSLGTPPPGLSLNSSTGLLSGTPTTKGDYTFKVKVTDGTRSDTQTYTLSIVDPLKISLGTAVGEVGLLFHLEPKPTGGKPAYTFSLGTGDVLPSGLTFDPATGAVNGEPTAPGKFSLKLTVTDSLSLTNTLDVPLVVVPKLFIVRKPLPAMKVGSPIDAKLVARGGARPRKWAILGGVPGTLPPGIKFDAKTGGLSGTPTKAGVWRLRFQVTDGLDAVASVAVRMKVTT
jgi:hypothetical protein